MLVRLRKNLSEADFRSLSDLARELGYRLHVLDGERELVRLEGQGIVIQFPACLYHQPAVLTLARQVTLHQVDEPRSPYRLECAGW